MSKIVDDFEYNILHHLLGNNLLCNIKVDFWFGLYLYRFYFVEKMGNFHFVLRVSWLIVEIY